MVLRRSKKEVATKEPVQLLVQELETVPPQLMRLISHISSAHDKKNRIPLFDVDSSTLPFLAEESELLAGWELYER